MKPSWQRNPPGGVQNRVCARVLNEALNDIIHQMGSLAQPHIGVFQRLLFHGRSGPLANMQAHTMVHVKLGEAAHNVEDPAWGDLLEPIWGALRVEGFR